MDTEAHYLKSLFEPAAIAVIGASESEGSAGRIVARNLIDGGFAGELYFINPRHPSVFGLATVGAIDKLKKRVDLAIICTHISRIVATIDACGKAGVRNVMVVTGSHAEAGERFANLQRDIRKKARRHGMRLLGPDSLGFQLPRLKLNATHTLTPLGRPGSLALISQSGGLFAAALDWAAETTLSCSMVVSMGAECDVDFGEVLDYLVADYRTESIVLFIENIKNARHFMSALRAAARCKPVLLIKIGRNTTTARTKLADAPAQIGADDVFDSALRRSGVVRLSTLSQMYAAVKALFTRFHPRGNRLAIIANGSSPGVMAADRATDLHIPLAQLLPETIARLSKQLPASWVAGNPLDIFSDADPARFAAALEACLHDEQVDGVMVMLTPHVHTDPLRTAEQVIRVATNANKPVIACWIGGERVAQAIHSLQMAGIPTFHTPEPAVEMFSHISAYYRAQQLLMQAPASTSDQKPPRIESARLVIEAALIEGRTVLSPMEAKAVLAAFHIPIVHTVMARSASEALVLADEIGLPVAMKVSSPNIRKKADCGGVRLNLHDMATIRELYPVIIKDVKRSHPNARIDGICIEPMVHMPNGRELRVSMFHDTVFGPTIAFGLGGSEGEAAMNDRAVALPPLNPFLINDMLRSTRASQRLGEFRKMPPVDMEALQAVLLRVSEMVCELPWIQSLNIDPLIIDDKRAVAVDVRIAIGPIPATSGRYDHVAIHPYPAHLVNHFHAADGARLIIRPIRPEDAAMEQAFVQTLSPQSRYLRFMNTIRELSPMQLARLTQIDYDRELAFVAINENSAPAVEVGVARYVANPDGESCEFAIVVADEWQGTGLARQMMHLLIDAARHTSLKYMTGDFLSENRRMIHFVETLGFVISTHPDDATLKRGVLALHP